MTVADLEAQADAATAMAYSAREHGYAFAEVPAGRIRVGVTAGRLKSPTYHLNNLPVTRRRIECELGRANRAQTAMEAR